MNYIAVLFAALISLAHYYSESINLHKSKNKIISLGAGVMLAYLILEFFPRLFQSISVLNNTLFLFILIGFSLLHLVDKFIYQHASKKKKLSEIREAHSVAFFIYHFIIGVIILEVTNLSNLEGFLLFIPLLFHTAIGTISIKEIHNTIKTKSILKLVLAFSPVIGVLVASFYQIPIIMNHILLGLIGGVLLSIITREVKEL